MTPTARTLAYLRRGGFTVDVVERWLPRVGRRKDFLGCIDILACRRGETGVLAIQATTLANVSARVAKSRGQGALSVWLSSGQRFEVWGWHKSGDRWQVKRVEIVAADMAPIVLAAPKRRGRAKQAIFPGW